jgi:antirestriction protein ArdC
MPPFEVFAGPIAYYSTLSHEATHWTAHTSRLDRDLAGRFGTESYAAEELVAELGAAFLAADLELTPDPRPENAAYIQPWLKVLKEDSHAIFTASSHAQRAVDFMHGLQAPLIEPQEVLAPAMVLQP